MSESFRKQFARWQVPVRTRESATASWPGPQPLRRRPGGLKRRRAGFEVSSALRIRDAVARGHYHSTAGER
jgi:hypothetical protein